MITFSQLIESLGGHPANYRNPAEGKPKFGKTESPKDHDTYVITNNRANISGDLASKVGDIVNVKSDRSTTHRMEVLKINGDKLTVAPAKKKSLNEGDSHKSDTAYYYLINKVGASVTAHTSQPFFHSYKEAKEYQKKYKHISSIKSSNIVKGKSDQHGFISVIEEDEVTNSKSS